MNNNFTIYEAAMCCSSGVCGPNPDKSLIDLQDLLDKVKEMGAEVERYSITGNPKKFRENPEVIKHIQEKQIKALPITTLNGKVIKVGSYPTLDELKNVLHPDAKESLVIMAEEGCCAGQNSCDISCGPNYKSGIKANTKGKCC